MKKIANVAILANLALIFVACVELSPEAQRIILANDKPQDCTLLGSEIGKIIDIAGAMSVSALMQGAENDLRQRAAKLGGDTLYILNADKNWNDALGGYEQIINGEVYKCGNDSGDISESSSLGDFKDSHESIKSNAPSDSSEKIRSNRSQNMRDL